MNTQYTANGSLLCLWALSLIACGQVDSPANESTPDDAGTYEATEVSDEKLIAYPDAPTFCGHYAQLKTGLRSLHDQQTCARAQDAYLSDPDALISLRDKDTCCECFLPEGTFCPTGYELGSRSRCSHLNVQYSAAFEQATGFLHCPDIRPGDLNTCCTEADPEPDPVPDPCTGDAPGAFCEGAECDEKIPSAGGLCCLGANCGPAAGGRGNMLLPDLGMDCTSLILQMADPRNESTAGSAACRELQNQYHRICMTDEFPACGGTTAYQCDGSHSAAPRLCEGPGPFEPSQLCQTPSDQPYFPTASSVAIAWTVYPADQADLNRMYDATAARGYSTACLNGLFGGQLPFDDEATDYSDLPRMSFGTDMCEKMFHAYANGWVPLTDSGIGYYNLHGMFASACCGDAPAACSK